eukprot:scaffold4246_cov84-Isochrysis_galbana.AAC.1
MTRHRPQASRQSADEPAGQRRYGWLARTSGAGQRVGIPRRRASAAAGAGTAPCWITRRPLGIRAIPAAHTAFEEAETPQVVKDLTSTCLVLLFKMPKGRAGH